MGLFRRAFKKVFIILVHEQCELDDNNPVNSTQRALTNGLMFLDQSLLIYINLQDKNREILTADTVKLICEMNESRSKIISTDWNDEQILM